MDSGQRDLKNILIVSHLGLPWTRLGKQVTGNADHRQPPWTISDLDLQRRPQRGCFRLPPRLSIFYIVFLLCINIGLSSLASIYSQISVLCTSVLKSNSFSPNFLPLSFLSIPDLICPSEIRTFRCYEGTAYKLRPSPFGTYLPSPESVILLPEPNTA
jgi:hypothetical protein